MLAALPASADDALWCTDAERAAFRDQAPSGFNPSVFVIPKDPAVKTAAGGSVDLLVSLEADGRVASACVLESEPKGVFEQVTAEAVRQWRYASADAAMLPAEDLRMKVHVGYAMK